MGDKMNAVGFATSYSLVDLLDELPLPQALDLKDNDRLLNEPLDVQNLQELQDVAGVIAPSIQMARLSREFDNLRFKDNAHTPSPNVRQHHAQATPLMSLVVNQFKQFQDIITVPAIQIPTTPQHQPTHPQHHGHPQAQQQQQQQQPPPPPQAQQQPILPQQTHQTIPQHIPTQPIPPPPQTSQRQPHSPIHPAHQTPQHQFHQHQQHPQQHHHQQPPQQQQPIQQHPNQQQHIQQQQQLMQQQQQHRHQQHLQQQHLHQQAPHHLAHQQPPIQHHQQPQINPQQQHQQLHQVATQQQQQQFHVHHQPQPQQIQQQPSHYATQQATHYNQQQATHYPQQQQVHYPQQPQHQQPLHYQQQQQPQPLQIQQLPIPKRQSQPQYSQISQQVAQVRAQPHSQPVKRKTERDKQRERERKAIKSEMVIDTRHHTLEEILENFLQDTITNSMSGSVGDLLYNFNSEQLLFLVSITAKLKRKNKTKHINLNKLTSLMTTLSSQLQVQTEVLKNNSYKDENHYDDDEPEQNGRTDNIRMQKFETCCDCAVVALNVMTASGMDSRVYLEECVEAIINFVNIALTIITDTSSGNFCPSPKKSSKHQGDKRQTKRILFTKQCLSKLNAKCSEVLALVNQLLDCRTDATLNDSLLLSTSRAALTAFFLMDSSTTSNELQLNALNVITAIFASYKNHQTVILDELIHSIARLPTTKRNRVSYQIGTNNSESISIFSALIMKLIQSLFTIRKNSLTEEKNTTGKSENSSSQSSEITDITDYERILKSQYHSALRASYAFLSSFLRRCCGVDKKDDCDYRVLFETFVEDLMTCLYKPDWSSAQLITHVLIKLLISNINPQQGKKAQMATNQTLKLASLEHLGTICARMMKEKSTLPKYKEEVKKALDAIDMSSLNATQRPETRSNSLKMKRKRSKKKAKISGSDTEEEMGSINGSDDEDSDEITILSSEDEQKFWLALLTFCQRENYITKCGRNIFCAIWLKELERRAKNEYELNNPTLPETTDYMSDEEESNGPKTNNTIKQYSRDNNNEEPPRVQNGPSAEDIQAKLVQDFFKLVSISARCSNLKKNVIDNENALTPESADEDSTIDDMTASIIIKILDVSLPTTQRLIDASLSHVVAALSTTGNTNIRSRAMKSLSHVLNDAPKDCAAKLLARSDLQRAIGASLLDQSTSVRESTVELIGRFILNSQSEELIDQYYDMLTNRIMDSGVSVRKRVIKILREICMTYPTYPRVPEICSIIIKRINDEGEGIRKLVSETFTSMWFKEERSHEAIVAKVACITHVVATVWSKILADANKSSGTESHFEWLHQLLSSLLKVKPSQEEQANPVSKRKSRNSEVESTEDGEVVSQEIINVKQTLAASTQIIAVLVSEKLSNGSNESSSRADCLAAMTALWSFAKISPSLLSHHLDLFQSFLSMDAKSSFDMLILEKVIQIIELILTSISNAPSNTIESIELNLSKLIFVGSISVISASVSCLSESIHRHSHNQELANATFKRFLSHIRFCKANPETNQQSRFLRALYNSGLLAKYFNIDDRDALYNELIYFVEVGISQMNRNQNLLQNPYQTQPRKQQDERVLYRSIEGLGFMFERSPALMLKESTLKVYRFFMRRAIDLSHNDSAVASSCVLTNLRNYLQDEVNQEIKSASSIDWSRENLKEMTSSKQEDANSIQSSVIQLYLRDMLSCALSSSVDIRKAAIKLIHSVHNGGHINPLSIVPSLIALSSDEDSTIRIRADHVLQEIERKYSNFVNMKSKQGVLESFILNRRKRGFHRLDLDKSATNTNISDLHQSNEQTTENNTQGNSDYINVCAKLSTLYSVVATNRQQRRAFINALLRYFDLQTLASAPNMLSSDPNESRFVLSKCSRSDILQYVTDNLMFLPFTLLDEPFFLIHQIGITMSNLVSQAVSQFREILQLSNMEDEEVEDEDIEINDDELSDDSTEAEVTDEEEDVEHRRQRKFLEKQNRLRQRKLELRQRKHQQRGLEQNLIDAIEAQDNNNEIDDMPVSILQVRDLVSSLHRCVLLMHCRKVIWDLYGITEQKFEDYTPNESTKVTDKPTHRRNLDEQQLESIVNMPPTSVHFDSEPFLRSLYSDIFGFEDDAETCQQLEQCAPNRHKLKLEYKRFSQMITK